jgi:hypothetical protein
MNTKTQTSESWTVDEQATNELQTLHLQVASLTAVNTSKPSLAELEAMSEFERARHTSKTWTMGQD